MPRTYENLTLADAKRMLDVGEAKADELGIPYNIAVVDAGGHLSDRGGSELKESENEHRGQ